VFDLLATADVLVAEVEPVARTLVRTLDLPQPRSSWIQDVPDDRCLAYWLRTQLDRGVAPTALEVIGPHPDTGWSEVLEAAHRAQGQRPMQTHATVVGVDDLDAVASRLRHASASFLLEPVQDGPIRFPPRLWVGHGRAGGVRVYDPSHDAGLLVEVIPTVELRLPEAAADPAPSDVAEGAVVRVAARSFLVSDVDHSLGLLERNLGWEPADAVHVSAVDGARLASYRGTMPGSAAVELIEPGSDASAISDHFGSWGPGAYRLTLSVNGLEAAAKRLDADGVPYDVLEGRGRDRTRVRIAPASVHNLVVELIDD
jgi:hypothetical protein